MKKLVPLVPFEELTDVTRKTWNRKIEDLASNAVLHMEAKKSTHGNAVMKQEKEIRNISRALPKLGNTILPRELIHTHAGHWEAHLKSILRYHDPPSWIACRTKATLDGHVIISRVALQGF